MTPFEVKMYFSDIYKKVRRFRLLEPSLGVLGLIVCVIFCFFLLDYGSVSKGIWFGTHKPNEWFLWMRSQGDVNVEDTSKKIDFLSDANGVCDLFDGDWMWDESYPLYQSRDCRFLDEGFRCSENGRPDLFYTKWRWQPKNCNLPRLDAKMMLEKLRNRRVVFVGDSIGRNQWESLLCILSSAISDMNAIYEVNGNPITKHNGYLIFKFMEYNCTVEYYRAPFLVLQSRPPPDVPSKIKTTLKLDQMDWTADKWKDADVLVFNTGHWWNNEKTIRVGCYFQEGSDVKIDMGVELAYWRSLRTVLEWVNREVNTTKTQVLFRTYAPVHFRGGDWRSGGTCHLETVPELGSSLKPSHTWTKYAILAKFIRDRSNLTDLRGLELLNVTHMTSKRKDGHPSLYYLGPTGIAPIHKQDCSHWCLPGIPDSWNELLYALFLRRELTRTSSS